MAMGPEERFDRIERQQEFLAASHAQHVARMAAIEAHFEEAARKHSQLEDLTLRIARIVEVQATRADGLTQSMDALAQRMNTLAESQTHTDERLNALISTVERYISNGRNRRN